MRKGLIRSLMSGVAFCSLAVAAAAAEIEAQSRIAAVTVYPDAAIVERVVEIDLPQGGSVLVFRGLPLTIDPNSLRLEGQASGSLTLGAVEARRTPGDPARAASQHAEQLRTLRAERDRIVAEQETAEGRKAMIQRFAQSGPERQGENGRGLDVEKWTAAWEAVGSGLARVNDELRGIRERLKTVDDRIRALEQAESVARRAGQPEREFTVALEAGEALKGKLTLSYRVSGAAWRPAYDARLDTGAGGKASQLTLTRRAVVTQRTGEDWTDVAVTLSTVRTARGTAAPDVSPLRVSYFEPPVAMPMAVGRATLAQEAADAASAKRRAEAPMAAAPPPATPMKAAGVIEATVDSTGFQASYRLPGLLTIPKDGAEKSLPIQSRVIQPDLQVRTAPALDPTAYLEVSFANTEEAPLLAGDVSLIRDGAFIGRGRIAQTPQGERTQLGFGADDRVKVTRVPIRRRETDPASLASAKTDTRDFKTTIRNLHDFPIRAVIQDQLPYSEVSTLTVEALATNTPPTEKTVQDKRGVLGWTYDLKAGEEREIRFGYRLRWPADRELQYDRVPQTR